MSVAIRQSRNVDYRDLIKRSPVAGLYEVELMFKRWLRTSEEVWIGSINDEIACAWGLSPPSIISDRAYLWLFVTDLVEKHKFIFVRHSQMIVRDMLKRYPIIVGHVVTKNEPAKNWLRWLGADLGPPEDGCRPFIIRRQIDG